MKRILIACASVALGAGVLVAASPEVATAIKSIQSVGADTAKMTAFCELYSAMDAAGEKEDPAAEEQVEELLTQLGPDFGKAWEVGGKLDETSADGKEFYAAVDGLAEKCE